MRTESRKGQRIFFIYWYYYLYEIVVIAELIDILDKLISETLIESILVSLSFNEEI